MHVAVFARDRAGRAERAGGLRRGRIVVVLCAALGLLTEKFTIAHTQRLLLDAEFIGARREALARHAWPLRLQRLRIDDELALARKIGGQRLLGETGEILAGGGRGRGPAQDDARTQGAIRRARPIVENTEADDEIVACRETEPDEIQALSVDPMTAIAVSRERHRPARRRDVLARSLRERDR